MRLSHLLDVFEPRREDDIAGVTIDVATGIVAGIALVMAILILVASLKPAALPAGSAAYYATGIDGR